MKYYYLMETTRRWQKHSQTYSDNYDGYCFATCSSKKEALKQFNQEIRKIKDNPRMELNHLNSCKDCVEITIEYFDENDENPAGIIVEVIAEAQIYKDGEVQKWIEKN